MSANQQLGFGPRECLVKGANENVNSLALFQIRDGEHARPAPRGRLRNEERSVNEDRDRGPCSLVRRQGLHASCETLAPCDATCQTAQCPGCGGQNKGSA